MFYRSSLFLIILLAASLARAADSPSVESFEILSPVYRINQIYRSMKGPQSTQNVLLLEENMDPELLWIVGYRAVMVDGKGKTPMSQEFMCHSNLDFDVQKHRQTFRWQKNASRRLFTLSQGQFVIEFPEGFGIPILSNEALSLTTQVLNLSIDDRKFKVRHNVAVDFVREKNLTAPMKPLFMKAANGLVLLEGTIGYYAEGSPDESVHGPGCLIGENASSRVRKDQFGRSFTGHWVVKPGREVHHTLVTHYLQLPYDTTVHYIAVHLHPFAESLELRDLTDDTTVFKSRVEAPADRIGIDRVDYFSSAEGLPVFKDHEYEIISIYNNTTDEDQDSMAVMYLYVLDKDTQLPIFASGAPEPTLN